VKQVVLIIEDQPSDLKIAANAAERSGFSVVEARSSSGAAKAYLEKGLEGTRPLPDAIVLDIDLGHESGFELLRYWYGDPRLSKIPLFVWTILGQQYEEMCQMFKVKGYIHKGDGGSALRSALDGLTKVDS
jgi:CheY-like chemotaxis protein